LARAPVTPTTSSESAAAATTGRGPARRQTEHLKCVPEPRAVRERIRQRCDEVGPRLDKSHPLSKDAMESIARAILDDLQLPEGFVGWTMVMLASAFWRDQVAAIPPARRLCLLPHCLKHSEQCSAPYDEFGLACRNCGACRIGDFRALAQQHGYRVLVAEGAPVVMNIILSGSVDAIVGVACLNVLEKAIDKVLLAGIPCIAMPLLSDNCQTTRLDEDWVREMILLRHTAETGTTRTYVHLMRAAARMFEHAALDRYAPRLRGGPRLSELNGQGLAALEPIAATEAIAYDFLARGGKYARPFITLAVYDAMTGGRGTGAGGAQHVAQLPDAIFRAAMSIETFHKASLVHDDIEDRDTTRRGRPTVWAVWGEGQAINAGDALLGLAELELLRLGERNVAAATVVSACELLNSTFVELTEGQYLDMAFEHQMEVSVAEYLAMVECKTATLLACACEMGARIAVAAGADDAAEAQRCAALGAFGRHLGLAFQMQDDVLGIWGDPARTGKPAGADLMRCKKTLPVVHGLERSAELRALLAGEAMEEEQVHRATALLDSTESRCYAETLAREHHARAVSALAEARVTGPASEALGELAETLLGRTH